MVYLLYGRTHAFSRRLGRNRRGDGRRRRHHHSIVVQTKLCASKPTRALARVYVCVCRNLVTASASECTNIRARAFVWTAEICSSLLRLRLLLLLLLHHLLPGIFGSTTGG